MKVKFQVEIEVEDDWSEMDYMRDRGQGRKNVVANRMRAATSKAVMRATIPFMEANGIVVCGIAISDPAWIGTDALTRDADANTETITDVQEFLGAD